MKKILLISLLFAFASVAIIANDKKDGKKEEPKKEEPKKEAAKKEEKSKK